MRNHFYFEKLVLFKTQEKVEKPKQLDKEMNQLDKLRQAEEMHKSVSNRKEVL